MNCAHCDGDVGYHMHRCDECRAVWGHCEHAQGKVREHMCPKCRAVQWWKFIPRGGR